MVGLLMEHREIRKDGFHDKRPIKILIVRFVLDLYMTLFFFLDRTTLSLVSPNLLSRHLGSIVSHRNLPGLYL